MTNHKALAVTQRAALSETLFEDPELTAMAAICEILQELPDEASRLRVMHWSFGRFNPAFKRQAPGPAPVARVPVAAEPTTMTQEIAAAAPALTEPAARNEDFGSQISELRDLFSGDVPRRHRPAYADAF